VEWALSTPDDRACVVGRRQFGRITIANADAAKLAYRRGDSTWVPPVSEIIQMRTVGQIFIQD